MDTSEDSVLAALPTAELCSRLEREDWKSDPLFVSNEQLFRLWSQARAGCDEKRLGILAAHLSRRMIALSRSYVLRLGLVARLGGDVKKASEQLAQFVWECLIRRANDAAHAKRKFGQLFKRRALDFCRRTTAKKNQGESLDPCQDDENEYQPEHEALKVLEDPADVLSTRQEHAAAVLRLRAILTAEEFFVYTMTHVDEMAVKDIAAALDVSTRTVNNYKNAAKEKVKKEFQK